MARIRTIDEKSATGELSEIYARIAGASGSVANILKCQSLSPATLDSHHRFYRSLMFGRNPLSRAQRELIAVVVSRTNGCRY